MKKYQIIELFGYCSCQHLYTPGSVIKVDKVNPPICSKCKKEIRTVVVEAQAQKEG